MEKLPLDDAPKPSSFRTLYGSPMSVVSSLGHGSPMSWRTSIGSPETHFGSPMVVCESAPGPSNWRVGRQSMLVDVNKAPYLGDRTIPPQVDHSEWLIPAAAVPQDFPECFECLQTLPLLHRFLKQSWHHGCFRRPSQGDFAQFVGSIPERCRDQYGGIRFSMLRQLTSYTPLTLRLTLYGKTPDTVDIVLVQWAHRLEWQIYHVSSYAAKYGPVITNSTSLHRVLVSDNPYEELKGLILPWSKAILDLIQLEIEVTVTSGGREECICLLQNLVRTYRQLPPQYYINDVNKVDANPITGGGFSDIWKGRHNNNTVCLKVLRVFMVQLDQNKIFKECCQEAVIWKQFKHVNILPFIGVNTELFSPSFCLISPWMSNGNVIDYLRQLKNVENHDISELSLEAIRGIASGMQYLHNFNPQIVHGDIRGANVLVDDEGVCRLADFGLAQIAETTGFKDSYSVEGSTRWLAPEIWDSSMYPDFPTPSASWARDVYAFGCTAYEIATLNHPFSDLKTDPSVMCAVLSGKRPPRLLSYKLLKDDGLWDIINQCWSHNPTSRRSADAIVARLAMFVLSPDSTTSPLEDFQIKDFGHSLSLLGLVKVAEADAIPPSPSFTVDGLLTPPLLALELTSDASDALPPVRKYKEKDERKKALEKE